MSTNAKEAKFRRQMDALDRHKAEMKKPADQRVAANLMPGREQIRIHNDIEEAGMELGAIYHSHTRTEPAPSQTDITFAQGWPGVLWVIVGLTTPEPQVRTWLIEDRQATEAELAVQ